MYKQIETMSDKKENKEEVSLEKLIAISNDSLITRNVYKSLKSKLNKEEVKDFELWMKLINYYGQLK